MFGVLATSKKTRKKLTFKTRIFYLKPYKRLLFVWKWLGLSIRSMYTSGVSRKLSLIYGLENFLSAPLENHIVSKVKVKIYKVYMLRLT